MTDVWQPLFVAHPMSTDEDPPEPAMVRPVEGRLNIRLLVTDSTGAVSGMDAGNVSEELTKSLISKLIHDHAAEVKRVVAETQTTTGGKRE